MNGLELRSRLSSDGTLELSLAEVTLPAPGPDDVVVRVEATPINPSDLGLLLGPADLATGVASGTPDRPVITARAPVESLGLLAARLGQSLPVGNEGAGTVIRAGEDATHLLGRTVSMFGGAMWAQHRLIKAAACMPLPDGTTARDGASWFVNPLTALGMIETMRLEGHTALVHTAAASNLGQMLNRISLEDGVGLVNIVRSPAQAALLRAQGASHVCDSTAPDFAAALTDALHATGATIAFDAIGGGPLADTILACMEAALKRSATGYSHYGTERHKQVYLYGRLNTAPTVFDRGQYGSAWGIGGWLLGPCLRRIGLEATNRLKQRVVQGLRTTFASHYTAEIGLRDVLNLDTLRACAQRATGEKYLIRP